MRYSGKEIPKIIHLTCGPGKLPEVYQKCLDQLRKLHPDWAIVVHNDSESRAVISKHMPALLNVYDAYSFKIQRADMFRIAVVYIFGGFYLDMDLFCRKPLDSLCLFQLVLGEEKTLSKKENRKLRHRYLLRIANYMFGSVPGHPFWIQLLKAMVTRSQTLIRREEDILDSTGPGLLTDFYHANKNIYRDITVIQNLDRVCPNKWCGKVSCHFGDYGLHLHVGSWRWGNRKQLPSDLKQRADDGEYIEETIQLLENMHTSDNHSLGDNLILLETYDSKAGYFDGLSIVYDRAS
jgi:mannosyltransferase OCH1-like enzyme